MPDDAKLGTLLDFLSALDNASIHYTLANPTQAIMVMVAVPGQRGEIEFHRDGEIGVEIFTSSGAIAGAENLQELLRDFSD